MSGPAGEGPIFGETPGQKMWRGLRRQREEGAHLNKSVQFLDGTLRMHDGIFWCKPVDVPSIPIAAGDFLLDVLYRGEVFGFNAAVPLVCSVSPRFGTSSGLLRVVLGILSVL